MQKEEYFFTFYVNVIQLSSLQYDDSWMSTDDEMDRMGADQEVISA
jgi:hypothetical protein